MGNIYVNQGILLNSIYFSIFVIYLLKKDILYLLMQVSGLGVCFVFFCIMNSVRLQT